MKTFVTLQFGKTNVFILQYKNPEDLKLKVLMNIFIL